MDLRHVTGELIFQGNRRALHNLVRIFMRITHIPRYSVIPSPSSDASLIYSSRSSGVDENHQDGMAALSV
jgi:hypothetical protein